MWGIEREKNDDDGGPFIGKRRFMIISGKKKETPFCKRGGGKNALDPSRKKERGPRGLYAARGPCISYSLATLSRCVMVTRASL